MWNGINRRKFPRANYPCKITIQKKDSFDSISAQTENIGIGGICTMLPKDLGIFSPVELKVDLLDGQKTVECDGCIVWIIQRKDNQEILFDTGIEFSNLKTEDRSRIEDIVVKKIGEEN